jgi:hypothetical protein
VYEQRRSGNAFLLQYRKSFNKRGFSTEIVISAYQEHRITSGQSEHPVFHRSVTTSGPEYSLIDQICKPVEVMIAARPSDLKTLTFWSRGGTEPLRVTYGSWRKPINGDVIDFNSAKREL